MDYCLTLTIFCLDNGIHLTHEYQLYLAIEYIDHSKTRARSPQANGICECFHKIVLNEFYQIAFRKKVYSSLDELQEDLNQWLKWYNEEKNSFRKILFWQNPYADLSGFVTYCQRKNAGCQTDTFANGKSLRLSLSQYDDCFLLAVSIRIRSRYLFIM